MSPTQVLDIGQDALWVLLKVGGPLMLVSLGVGLIISFFQALTQIQEMTLAFIPKILATFAMIIFMLPFIGRTLGGFALVLFDRMVALAS